MHPRMGWGESRYSSANLGLEGHSAGVDAVHTAGALSPAHDTERRTHPHHRRRRRSRQRGLLHWCPLKHHPRLLQTSWTSMVLHCSLPPSLCILTSPSRRCSTCLDDNRADLVAGSADSSYTHNSSAFAVTNPTCRLRVQPYPLILAS